MGIIKSKFKKMEEFDCSMDEMDGKFAEKEANDPRSPSSAISRTPMNELRAKSSLITRATDLANISTPIHNDLLMIQDKRFKHLAHSFIDPRSPSEGIVRTPIVIKSTDISSIINTPRILEEELNESEDDEEDFQKTFEERLSRLSFDCLEQDGEAEQLAKLPALIETHFDECLLSQPVPPMTLATNLVAKSVLDPRSPSLGIDRTPLVFGDRHPIANHKPIGPTFADQLERHEQVTADIGRDDQDAEEEGENEQIEEEKEDDTKEVAAVPVEQKEQPTIIEPTESPSEQEHPQSEVFVDVGHVIYGTPVKITSSGGPIQQVRTPLSCLANRKRSELNGKGASATSNAKKQQKVHSMKESELKVKKTATNPFESTTPRKAIR